MQVLFSILAVISLLFISACDDSEKTTSEKVESAVDDASDGAEEAVEGLQNKSTGEKIGDEVKDAGEEIQEHSK